MKLSVDLGLASSSALQHLQKIVSDNNYKLNFKWNIYQAGQHSIHIYISQISFIDIPTQYPPYKTKKRISRLVQSYWYIIDSEDINTVKERACQKILEDMFRAYTVPVPPQEPIQETL